MDAHANEDRNMNNDVSSNVNSDMNIQNEGSCRPTVCNDSNCLNKNRLNASTNDIGTITNESFIKNNCKKTYDIKNCNNNKVSYKNNVTNTNSTQTFCCNKTYSTCGTNTEEPIPVQLQTSRERPKSAPYLRLKNPKSLIHYCSLKLLTNAISSACQLVNSFSEQ